MVELKSPFFHFVCSPEGGEFSLTPVDTHLPAVQGARLKIVINRGGERIRCLENSWAGAEVSSIPLKSKEHGKMSALQVMVKDEVNSLVFHLTFALPKVHALFLWKMDIENQGETPVTVERFELIRVGLNGSSSGNEAHGRISMGKGENGSLSFYSNGWQSWSYTGAYLAEDKQRRTHLGMLQAPMTLNPTTPQPRWAGYFTGDFYGVIGDRSQRTGLVAGFLSQKQQFGSIETTLYRHPTLRMTASGDQARLDPLAKMETDWAALACVSLETPEPMKDYLDAVVRENAIRLPKDVPVGWCSWYHFYTKVTAKAVQENLNTIVELKETLPIQLVQIDDGFETQVGDWFTFKPTFPDGVASLAQEIKDQGLTPGLWLAPFIIHPSSEVYKKHPDWILRKENGKPVNAGFCWNALCTALDLTNPAALEYAVRAVKTAAVEWGYPYLKLDFLYAAALPGKYQDGTKTRAQALRMGMEALRAAVGPEVFLLACGAPLGSVLGLVEANRIGADVSGTWKPNFSGVKIGLGNEPHMPSASISIHNIITRAFLHRNFWLNDPDCLLVRPDTELTLAEVQTLATVIALTGGSLLLSDDLPKLPAERIEIACSLIPVIDRRAWVVDWMDAQTPAHIRLDLEGVQGRWHVLACFNWSEKTAPVTVDLKDYRLPESEYYARPFWAGKTSILKMEKPLVIPDVPAHGVVLLAVRMKKPGEAQYIGSSLHISQGLELMEWNPTEAGVELKLALPRQAHGDVEVSLPRPPRIARVDGVPIPWRSLGDTLYAFTVEFASVCCLQVEY